MNKNKVPFSFSDGVLSMSMVTDFVDIQFHVDGKVIEGIFLKTNIKLILTFTRYVS
jgi:hypothetical protein